jgi:hypothetical protein
MATRVQIFNKEIFIKHSKLNHKNYKPKINYKTQQLQTNTACPQVLEGMCSSK